MILDVHCHYTLTDRPANAAPRFSFEPARDAGGAPAWDSCVAPRAARWWTWRIMQRMLGIDARLRPGAELDAQLERVYERHLLGPSPIDRFVLLAFDWYHDRDGRRPPLPRHDGPLGSDIYTSNSLVAELCRRRPDRFLFGASVHPYRENAVECVDEVAAAGACLIKWLPLHQNIDVHDPRTLSVMRRCADLRLPLLVHFCEEFTLTTQHPEFQSVTALLDVLRRLRDAGRMPPVIVAHAATPISPIGPRAAHRIFLDALLGEFADAPLYADVSALTAWGKVGFLRALARRQELHPRLLFGSDFPVPIALPRLRRELGRDFARVAAEPSWPVRALHVFRRSGFNEIVFHRAEQVLAARLPRAGSP